jgi:hypothetical protein
MTQYPQIGFPTTREYLQDALLPAYNRFQQKQTRDTLLGVASPAWALHERLWHDQGCKPDIEQFRADLFTACPELDLLRDYVEAAKHTGLNRKGVRLVSLTGAENPGGIAEIADQFGQRRTTLDCTLTLNYADGTSYRVTDVVKRVVEFWVKKLSQPSP